MADVVQEIAGMRVLVAGTDGDPVRGEQDAVDLMAGTYFDQVHWVALPASRLTDEFFELSSGVAGQILQKFVNYRIGLAVLGDFSRLTADSTALEAFVRESNGGRHAWFLADLDEFRDRLAADAHGGQSVSGS